MPLHNDFADQHCSIARTLELVGERWSLLILRDASLGVRRFDDFRERLGISRNVLAARLTKLVDEGILRREQYSEHPPRYEYRLTARGLDLIPVLLAMAAFGDQHAPSPDGPPRVFRHRECGTEIDLVHLHCPACDQLLGVREIRSEPGPGAGAHPAPAVAPGA